MRILVVTSCTGEKKYHPENQLTQEDFASTDTLQSRERELCDYLTPAGEMYTGMQHLRLMEGLSDIRAITSHHTIDLCIVSAGYGVIDEKKVIAPYEVTFNTMTGSAISAWSDYLGIHSKLSSMLDGYDLVFFLLGDKYLKAIKLPFESVAEHQRLLFFASGTSRRMIPSEAPYYFINVGQDDATSFSYGLVGLKGND